MFLEVYFFTQKTQSVWKCRAPVCRTKLSNTLEIVFAVCIFYPVVNILICEGRGRDSVECQPSCRCLVLCKGKIESFLCTFSPCKHILQPNQRQTTLLAIWTSYQKHCIVEGHLTHPIYFRDQTDDLWEGLTEAQQLKKLHLSSS